MIHVSVDFNDLFSLEGLEEKAKEAAKKASRDLTMATHAHAIELANEKLHSRKKLYLDNLHMVQESDDTWLIQLDVKAGWIEDGQEAHSMVDDLLSSPKAKTAADGSKYMAVPFNHGPKGSTEMTQAQSDLLSTIKQEMKKFKIPYAGIETNNAGQPKLGLLHTLDITKRPVKGFDGPGQGSGPIGQVRQGKTGIPFLQGVKIYQNKVSDGLGGEKIQRSIMTFRTVSSKHKGDKWNHPGVTGVHILEDSFQWASEQVNVMAPAILDDLFSKL